MDMYSRSMITLYWNLLSGQRVQFVEAWKVYFLYLQIFCKNDERLFATQIEGRRTDAGAFDSLL